jgi:hypothetical protein
MKYIRRPFVRALFCSLFLVSLCQAIEPGFIPLLDRDHTDGWKMIGPGDVRLKDGEVTTSSPKGNGVFWYSPRVFNDFVLKLEFKGAQREFNSGVFIRFPAPRLDAMPSVTGNEIAIYDGLDKDRPTGSIYNYQDSSSAPMKQGDWNEFEITSNGSRVVIKLNGQSINDFTGLRQPTGFIGLQCHPRGPVQFRNVRIKDLSTPAPTLSAPLASIQTDANQPRIEVLKDQGPNALEWALAPLDQPLPPDIRQNLTYLREDLLDEAKQKPKAGSSAYTLGSELCDKLLTAVELRNQASVAAGYTAAQADAGVRVDGSGINARRNYTMSWPQYAREKDQRSEIMRQQLTGADLKKERTKVEWALRARAMRKALDDLYRQFRESLRISVSK